MHPETRYARSGDVSIAYQIIGARARDLVFVPGITSHVEFFHELPGYSDFLDRLAAFARVIAFRQARQRTVRPCGRGIRAAWTVLGGIRWDTPWRVVAARLSLFAGY